MPFFNTEDKTIYSPVNPELEELYSFLEKHQKLMSGSAFYDQLIAIYRKLDKKSRGVE